MRADNSRRLTPEERELDRKHTALAALEARLTQQELELTTLQVELRAFEAHYLRVVGRRYAELDDIEATVEHVKRTDPDVFFTTVSYPIKGTPYFSDVENRVESLKPWREGSDRDFRIRNRHSRQFYRFADRLLRSEVELNRLGRRENAANADVVALRSGIAEARAGLQATLREVEA